MAVLLIALDIDGTLIDSRWCVSDANRGAIQRATRCGIEVALVTGRRYDFALPVAQDLGCPITMIVNNGGLIRSNDGCTRLKRLLPLSAGGAGLGKGRPRGGRAAPGFSRAQEDPRSFPKVGPAEPHC